MKEKSQKCFPTIACCGIDCGLCPRFYTEGKSRCPGCMGENFSEKHPSCPIITCSFKNKGFETCAECAQFPCDRLKYWDRADSFVTHMKTLTNLKLIIDNGLTAFIEQQKARINILKKLIDENDDGRSKSFYCLAVALMNTEDLNTAINQLKVNDKKSMDKKQLALHTRTIIQQVAQLNGIELKYRREKACG
jgi:hypothetical protein